MIVAVFHKNGSERILAACDSELAGKRFEDADLVLDLGTQFFKGSKVSEEEFRGMLAQATSANIVGRNAVRIAVETRCIHEEAVGEICGIPFAMFFCMG
jgi:hypothetical protein